MDADRTPPAAQDQPRRDWQGNYVEQETIHAQTRRMEQEQRADARSAVRIEDDVVTLRKALDYPKLGYGYAYREALEALDRLAEAAHASERLREALRPVRPMEGDAV